MKLSIQSELELWYNKFFACESNVQKFIAHDPVQFPRLYKKRADIEIAAFLAATIAWGRRDIIINSAKKMFSLMDNSPADYIMAGNFRNLKDKCVHRTFFEADLKYFCIGLKHCYAKYNSLEELFLSVCGKDLTQRHRGTEDTTYHCEINQTNTIPWGAISLFREEMAAANKGIYSKHIANPDAGSACKRINLALRWLVREGPIDLHLWKKFPASVLHIPLDVHVARTSRSLGLLTRKSCDRKAVIEITEKLRDICPEDPVKYDYALFGMGVGARDN